MYSFPDLEPVCCSMSSSNCCFWPAYGFLRRQVRWSGIPVSWRTHRIRKALLWWSFLWASLQQSLSLTGPLACFFWPEVYYFCYHCRQFLRSLEVRVRTEVENWHLCRLHLQDMTSSTVSLFLCTYQSSQVVLKKYFVQIYQPQLTRGMGSTGLELDSIFKLQFLKISCLEFLWVLFISLTGVMCILDWWLFLYLQPQSTPRFSLRPFVISSFCFFLALCASR